MATKHFYLEEGSTNIELIEKLHQMYRKWGGPVNADMISTHVWKDETWQALCRELTDKGIVYGFHADRSMTIFGDFKVVQPIVDRHYDGSTSPAARAFFQEIGVLEVN